MTARLREIAELATPGPWTASGNDDEPIVYGEPMRGTWVVADVRDGGLVDETFIVTFDPPTVLALLDVVEAARWADRLDKVFSHHVDDDEPLYVTTFGNAGEVAADEVDPDLTVGDLRSLCAALRRVREITGGAA